MKYNVNNVGENSYQAPELILWSMQAELGFAISDPGENSDFQGFTEDQWAW